MCKYEKRTKEDKMYEEMIEELKLEVESIQNELDNIVHELEQVERNKKAIEEVQDWLRESTFHLPLNERFYPIARVKKVD